MKKLILLFSVAFFAVASHAQFYVGGALGLTNTTLDLGGESDSKSNTSIKIIPEFGFKINDKIAVGMTASYNKGYSGMGSIAFNDLKGLVTTVLGSVGDVAYILTDADIKSFGISPYVRYTLYSQGIFSVYADGFFGYNHVKFEANNPLSDLDLFSDSDSDSDSDESKFNEKCNVYEFGVRPVIALNLSKRVQLNAKLGMIGFQSGKLKDAGTKLTHVGLDLDGNNIIFGATYSF